MIHEIALTVKPVMSCNMRCRHCFNGDSLNYPGLVDIREVYSLLKLAAKEYNDVKVNFHGGEPALAGYDFYEKVFVYERKLRNEFGTRFTNLFTTNGLLLTEKLSDLLIQNQTLINISFDGPYNYILRQHTEEVAKVIEDVKEKTENIRIYCTLCEQSYLYLEEIYQWFKERSLDFKVIPVEPLGYAKDEQDLTMDPEAFARQLGEVYTTWLTDQECAVRVFTFEEFVGLKRGTLFRPFWFNRKIALNPDGKLYPFGRPNDVKFCLGIPSELNSLSQCFHSNEYQRLCSILEDYWSNSDFCLNCDSKYICRGGVLCMSYMYDHEETALKFSCRQSKAIFATILDINDTIAEEFAAGNGKKYNAYVQRTFHSGSTIS